MLEIKQLFNKLKQMVKGKSVELGDIRFSDGEGNWEYLDANIKLDLDNPQEPEMVIAISDHWVVIPVADIVTSLKELGVNLSIN